jgi:hypothetical protein
MANEQNAEHIEDAQVVETTDLVVLVDIDKAIDSTITELKKSTAVTDEALSALKAEFSNFTINGIEDMVAYKAAKSGKSKLTKLRTSIEARRVELIEPALKWQREVNAEAKRITEELKSIEAPLVTEIKRIDDAKEAARQAEVQRRMQLLTENGYQLVNGFYVCGPVSVHGSELINLTEQQLEFHVTNGKEEIARQEAERKRQEELQAKLKAEQEEIARQKAEIARQQAEIEAQKKALEKTYEQATQPQAQQPTPQPQAQPTQPQQATPEPTAPKAPVSPQMPPQVSPVYLNGFNEFRRQLIEKLDNPDKFTRAELREWATGIQPK